MNEQIKKLANQAGFVLWKNESWNPGDTVDWSCRYDDELEKFAELIVKECVGICRDIDGEDNIDAKSGRQDCAVEIKEHFGVEE